MSLTQLLNVSHAVLIEGIDDDAERRLDRVMAGDVVPVESQTDAFLRARGRRPARGAPEEASFVFGQSPEVKTGPPKPPPGYKLAPAGVIVREPEPTRGLEHLRAALEKAR
jgi:hypothetical protein